MSAIPYQHRPTANYFEECGIKKLFPEIATSTYTTAATAYAFLEKSNGLHNSLFVYFVYYYYYYYFIPR